MKNYKCSSILGGEATFSPPSCFCCALSFRPTFAAGSMLTPILFSLLTLHYSSRVASSSIITFSSSPREVLSCWVFLPFMEVAPSLPASSSPYKVLPLLRNNLQRSSAVAASCLLFIIWSGPPLLSPPCTVAVPHLAIVKSDMVHFRDLFTLCVPVQLEQLPYQADVT